MLAHATTTECPSAKPFKYRVALMYIGGRNDPNQVGSSTLMMCLPREIKTEGDWDWLQHKLEVAPKVTRVTIMGISLLTD